VVWDLTTGKRVYSWPVPGTHPVEVLACHPGGRRVVLRERPRAGSSQSWCCVRDMADGQEQFHLPERTPPVLCAAYSPDGSRLLTGSADGAVTVWDADTGLELVTFRERRLPVRWLSFRADGRRFAAGCAAEARGRSLAAFVIWDARPVGRRGKD
jgi:WD40 repeat protein